MDNTRNIGFVLFQSSNIDRIQSRNIKMDAILGVTSEKLVESSMRR